MIQRGFTLIEVILGISLMVGLMIAALRFHQYAGSLRETIIDEVELVSSERVLMTRLTKELRAARSDSVWGNGLSGESDSIQMLTTALPGQSAWARESVTDDAAAPTLDTRIVRYHLVQSEDEYGEIVVAGISRREQVNVNKTKSEEGSDSTNSVMSTSLKFLRFKYWDGAAWTDAWTGDDLPIAVEIVLGTNQLPEGVEPDEYPLDYFRRVVYLPGAERDENATTVRGLSWNQNLND